MNTNGSCIVNLEKVEGSTILISTGEGNSMLKLSLDFMQ